MELERVTREAKEAAAAAEAVKAALQKQLADTDASMEELKTKLAKAEARSWGPGPGLGVGAEIRKAAGYRHASPLPAVSLVPCCGCTHGLCRIAWDVGLWCSCCQRFALTAGGFQPHWSRRASGAPPHNAARRAYAALSFILLGKQPPNDPPQIKVDELTAIAEEYEKGQRRPAGAKDSVLAAEQVQYLTEQVALKDRQLVAKDRQLTVLKQQRDELAQKVDEAEEREQRDRPAGASVAMLEKLELAERTCAALKRERDVLLAKLEEGSASGKAPSGKSIAEKLAVRIA